METSHTSVPAHGHVLGALDGSAYISSVSRHAAWAADRLGAPLELLHVIDAHDRRPSIDLSGSLGIDDEQSLLADLGAEDESHARRLHEVGRALLHQGTAAAIADHPVRVSTRMRHGDLTDTLVELQPDVRMFVVGKRGTHASDAETGIGGGVERIVRAVHRPLLVATRTFQPIDRALIAFDGSETMRRGVEMLAASQLLRGLELHVLMVGAADRARNDLEWAERALGAGGARLVLALLDGSPIPVIGAYAQEHRTDLLVMGAFGHSRIREILLGSTTTALLASSSTPVLILR